ncbi:hypothetical protein [Pseudobacteriovorax antillogorgiicola]|uniref:Uncharacterized protein n=1 Tax=Pseudobacteriovorax antillogorgiicola TaxID=1513793 RepID=A0A1Y6C1W9_9BACT|nr:hypothetical protein [Pseudobacteriovorax antillogorgiicola]TCS50759.1 hypothetical protein EDD56_112142 [Pseudobacteriovorax antillogorgiicola]SMF41172.1 hypothetical protein SAMN06296036_112141 [Pseudobacteriovorax antillogorgiicola]
MLVGAILTTAIFAGLGAADLTITIGEMATNGSFINPEISERRELLQSKYNDAVALDESLKEKVKELSELTNRTNLSYTTNQQIMANLSSHFSRISEIYVENLENGTFDAILDGSLPPSEIDPKLFNVSNYLAGTASLVASGSATYNAFTYFKQGRSYFDDIKLHKANVDALKGLNFKSKTITLPDGTTRLYSKAQLKQKIFKGKFGIGKLAARRPRLYARFKLMSARFSSPLLGAVSVASIVTQKLQSDSTLAEINAQIYGLDQFIRTINGLEVIEDENFLSGEINDKEEHGIRSIPDVEAYIQTMKEYRDWDYRQFLEVIRIFDIAYGNYKEELFNLLDDPAVRGVDQAFLGELVAELYKPGQRYPDANPRCRLDIPNAESYLISDMYCVQHTFRDFITQEGLELIAALVVKETEKLLDKDINAIRRTCTNPMFGVFEDKVLFCIMVDFNIPLFAIETTILDEFEEELCNGKDFFNRDGDHAKSLKFSEDSC